jgi:peptidoglycan/xylan/chitin deacetylase (PgdA/CDA1 family)
MNRILSWGPRGLWGTAVLLWFGVSVARTDQSTVSRLEPLPEKLVALTFDDSAKSHFDVVRPILLKYGFGATFFITEGFDFKDNNSDYMTWDQIAQLNRDGFEIGNHTRDHLSITTKNVPLHSLRPKLSRHSSRANQHFGRLAVLLRGF